MIGCVAELFVVLYGNAILSLKTIGVDTWLVSIGKVPEVNTKATIGDILDVVDDSWNNVI